jgi:arylsulfatase A-like enzyme
VPALPEQHLDGVSLVPALRGEGLPDRPLFWHYPHYGNQGGEPSAVIREGEWKLIHYFEDDHTELYHVNRDMGERENLVSSEPRRAAAMLERLKAWQKSVGARFPAVNPNWDEKAHEQSLDQLRQAGIARRDAEHAAALREDFVPRGGWWQKRGQKTAKKTKP